MIKRLLIAVASLCIPATGPLAQPTTDNNVVSEGREIAPTTQENVTQACSGPRPERIGCRYIGKPCIEFVCTNGQWEPVNIETSFPNRPGPTTPDIPCEFLERGCSPLPRR